jgi:hypothetical protein
MEHVVSVRVPKHWEGSFTSEQLRVWVLAWLSEPTPLRGDPGPGRYKLSVRFSGTELLQLRRRARRSVSSTLRAVAALHVSGEESSGSKWFRTIIEIGFIALTLFASSQGTVGQARGQKTQ